MLKTAEQREERQEGLRQRMAAPPETLFAEHFTVQELAALWKLSRRSVQRLVDKEPDIVRLGEEKPGKRRHLTIRVPAHVARRIYQKLTGAETEGPAEKKPPVRFASSLVRRSRA